MDGIGFVSFKPYSYLASARMAVRTIILLPAPAFDISSSWQVQALKIAFLSNRFLGVGLRVLSEGVPYWVMWQTAKEKNDPDKLIAMALGSICPIGTNAFF